VLESISGIVPAALSRRIYLECRLRETASQVDIVICVDQGSRGLLIPSHTVWLPEALRAHPLWSGVSRLCAAWADEPTLRSSIYDMWLEFDGEGSEQAPARIPSVFVGLRGFSSARDAWVCGLGCLERLSGRVRPAIAATARRCLQRLAPSTALSYVGLMYPRDQLAIRLCVAPLRGRALLRFLEAIEWPGSRDEVEQVLRRLGYDSERTACDAVSVVHIDVVDDVKPRLGVEIPFAQRQQLTAGLQEVRLLDSICDVGLCTAEKRRALETWPGHSIHRFAHECWPSLAVRRVSHLKAVFTPGHFPEMKAYLSSFYGAERRRQPV
jgi:hypothetical protein